MEKAFVAQRVAKKLFVTEAAVDGALAEASELMSEMLKARKDVHVSMVFADEAAVKMVEARFMYLPSFPRHRRRKRCSRYPSAGTDPALG